MTIWIILLLTLGSSIPDNENKLIGQIIMSSLSFFTVEVIFCGIRVMVFPISIICLFCSFCLAFYLTEHDVFDDLEARLSRKEEDDLPELRLMDLKRKEDYQPNMSFRVQLVCPHLVSLVILFLLATLCPNLFEGCVILGAINITFSALLISSQLYELDMISIPVRDAVDSISNETIEELTSIYPIGFDTDRFQYLLHDTLRIGRRGMWHGRTAHTTVTVIQKLINIFPSDIMKVVDDEGATPFLVACQCSSVKVVKYLIGRYDGLLDTRDNRGDTALHYACRGKNCKVVKYLLSKNMQLVTKRNTEGDLPVYLLGGASYDDDSNHLYDPEHVETIWHLLLAYPEDMS